MANENVKIILLDVRWNRNPTTEDVLGDKNGFGFPMNSLIQVFNILLDRDHRYYLMMYYFTQYVLEAFH